MNRNKNVDIFRAIALLLVMVYHGWVLCGSPALRYELVTLVVSLGGEIGVTAFFVLSGYGIYCSLDNMEKKHSFRYGSFLKKRAQRVVPQYTLSIVVVVLLSLPAYLSVDGAWNILTHLFYIHNLFPRYSGSINGVLWTMGVIVQFYLIAPILYRLLKKFGIKMELACILFTILLKGVIYAFVLPYTGHSADLAFFSGRQLGTSLDNFTIGMFVAYIIKEKKADLHIEAAFFVFFMGIIEIISICQFGVVKGIHTNNVSGYIRHSLLALGLGLLVFAISYMKPKKVGVIYNVFLWLSKYEYGIYIWHLLILSILLQKMTVFQNYLGRWYYWFICVVYMVLAVSMGYIISLILEKGQQATKLMISRLKR